MGNCSVIYREIRFNVDHEDLTDVYVLVDAKGDCPHTLPGWYHKQFLGLVGTLDLHQQMFKSEEMTPIYWEKKTPPDMVSDPRMDAVMQHVKMARAWMTAAAMMGNVNPEARILMSYLDDAIRDSTR